MRTAIAIAVKTGANKTRAAAEPITSIDLFKKPGNPETDLCRVNCCEDGFGFVFDPFLDEFPNLGLEGFTRKCLHLTADLLLRPDHRFKTADRTHNVIHV